VSSEAKAAVAREAGADEVLDGGGDWRAHLLELTGDGVDVVFDPVGGERFADSLRSLRLEGRLVVVGFAGGAIPQVAVNRLLLRNADVCGCTWGTLAARPNGVPAAGAELNGWVAAGSIRPIVGESYPLQSVGEALDRVARRASLGKTIVTT
jgi:NADPH2:quinone reductase